MDLARRILRADKVLAGWVIALSVLGLLVPPLLRTSSSLHLSDLYVRRDQLYLSGAFNDGAHLGSVKDGTYRDPFGHEWRYGPGTSAGSGYFSVGPDGVAGTQDDVDLILDWRLRLYQNLRFLCFLAAGFSSLFYAFARLIPVAARPILEGARAALLGVVITILAWWVDRENWEILAIIEAMWSYAGLPRLFYDLTTAHWVMFWGIGSASLWSARRYLATRVRELARDEPVVGQQAEDATGQCP